MKNIRTLNNIAEHGLKALNPENYRYGSDLSPAQGILVRSADLHEMPFEKELLAIARAGAGVNNIPLERCTREGIVVFNTPGGNANSVKELAVLALLLTARDVLGGIRWVREAGSAEDLEKRVEKGKAQFSGTEIMGRWLGVIGLGAVGGMVANAGHGLGMNVIGCDPFLSVEAAWSISRGVHRAPNYQEVFSAVDYLTLHVPSTPETKGMVNAQALARMKQGVRIINLARADLVVAQDLLAALDSGKVAWYITDFPTPELVGHGRVISIPHLGASTEEAEDNCALMAVRQLVDYLDNGNIVNSVNFPSASMPTSGDARLCILHRNIPAMLANFSGALSQGGVNIENMLNRSRGDIAYTIIEISGRYDDSMVQRVEVLDGVIRVRLLEEGRACEIPGLTRF